MLRKTIFLILIVFFIFSLNAYTNSRWETFTDMKGIVSVSVTRDNNSAFCATKGGLFMLNLNDGSIIQKYTNINGLINIDLTTCILDYQDRLWIGASDGSVSVFDYKNNSWKYIYDIKNSSENNKSVNDFVLYGTDIYAATGYGVQRISTLNYNFVDAPYYKLGTLSIKTAVNSLTIKNDTIYAATSSGIAYAPLRNSNLNNPSSWTTYNLTPFNVNVRTNAVFDNKVFFGSDGGFGYFDGIAWYDYPNSLVSRANTKFVTSSGDSLFFVSNNVVYYATRSNLPFINVFFNAANWTYIDFYGSQQRNVFGGTSDKGIYMDLGSGYSFVAPNGPQRSLFAYLSVDEMGTLWCAGGSADAGFYSFDGETFTNYSIYQTPQLGSSNNFHKITADRNVVWALSPGGGPTYMSGNVIRNFNTKNSILPGIPSDPNYCVPNGIAYDNNGVAWCTFYEVNSGKSLYAYLGDTVWYGITNPSIVLVANFEEIAVDNYNTKWIVSGYLSPRGLYFYNENGTLQQPQDDIYGIYTTADFGEGVNDVFDVIVDRNGEVWAATDNGVFIIANPQAVLQYPGQKPPAVKMSLISGNLKVPFTEFCYCITSDILNQKWIGTQNNGVFHISADGSTLIEQLNVSNSPILSNNIKSIVVNGKNGKAYFGTLSGLSSYQTNAVQPVAEFDKIKCSPNPYLLPANVDLKIDGLVENSVIKIISLTGELINTFESPGGRIATWNGRDSKGDIVPSGIYIIAAYNKEGTKVGTGKVAIIKK